MGFFSFRAAVLSSTARRQLDHDAHYTMRSFQERCGRNFQPTADQSGDMSVSAIRILERGIQSLPHLEVVA
jgi:hypothetical protein